MQRTPTSGDGRPPRQERPAEPKQAQEFSDRKPPASNAARTRFGLSEPETDQVRWDEV